MTNIEGKVDFLAIGDIVIDCFIRLKDAHVHCKIDTNACELCVTFGDKIPYDSAVVIPAVGNGPNAAVSAARLGLNVGLVTNVGDDAHGRECLEALSKENIRTDFISIEKDKVTNYHYVLLYEVDRTILVKHTEFDFKLPQLPPISWVYLTSLADHTLPYHMEIAEFLKAHPETKLAFQPGTFQMKLGTEVLKDIYARTEIFFCNLEEAQRILNLDGNQNVLELSKGLMALGPKIVSISDGPKGSYLYANNELWHIPMYPDTAPPIDRTGAGDAFASTLTAGLALGLTPLEAFSWGPINSMSVVQQIGAQRGLLTKEALESLIKSAPSDYIPTKV
jgi:ribokinase